MKKTRMTAQLATATVVIGITLGLAAPAAAAPAGCGSGAGCSWSEINYVGKGGAGQYNGGVLHFQRNIKNYALVSNLPGYHLNDKISSVYNNGRTGAKTRFFKDANYRGTVKSQTKNIGVANLGTISFNDVISSACFEGYCG